MFYYKNKVKAVVMIVAVVLLLAVAATFCLWDDTSLKSINAKGATTNFTGFRPLPSIATGARLTIDGIGYTVGNNNGTYITVFSDDVSSKGVTRVYDSRNMNFGYNGTRIDTYDPGGVPSEIYTSVTNYYNNTLASRNVVYNGFAYAYVSEYIVTHKDFGWSLWLPSLREIGLSSSKAAPQLEGSLQPVMSYYNSDSRREYRYPYWVRTVEKFFSTYNGVFIVEKTGNPTLHWAAGQYNYTRVALNLKIG